MAARFLRLIVLLAALLVGGGQPRLAHAHEYSLGGLEIVHPWARATAGSGKNAAAYVEIINRGAADDRLIAAASPLAASAELHRHVSQNGIMKMEAVESIEIPAGDRVTLQPGGLHIMLMGLHGPLAEGDSFPLTLVFATAGRIEVSVTIASVATMRSLHGANAAAP